MIFRNLLIVFLVIPSGIVHLHAQNERVDKEDNVRLVAKGVRLNANEITLDLTVENSTSSTIYICFDPQQLYGPKGYYFKIQAADASSGLFSCRVYPDPPFYSPVDATSVELRSVLPSQKYDVQLNVAFPLKETFPPFDDGLQAQKKSFKRSEIRKLVVEIGYFIDKEVVEIANRRVTGTMSVKLLGGREASLLDLQKFLRLDISLN